MCSILLCCWHPERLRNCVSSPSIVGYILNTSPTGLKVQAQLRGAASILIKWAELWGCRGFQVRLQLQKCTIQFGSPHPFNRVFNATIQSALTRQLPQRRPTATIAASCWPASLSAALIVVTRSDSDSRGNLVGSLCAFVVYQAPYRFLLIAVWTTIEVSR